MGGKRGLQAWSLQKIIEEICEDFPSIEEVYLFGSRAYSTGSLRSDIDLLVFSKKPINAQVMARLFPDNHPADIFLTEDMNTAVSSSNGSKVRTDHRSLIEKLDAILLWKHDQGFNPSFEDWTQYTHERVVFKKTTMLGEASPDDIYRSLIGCLEKNGLPSATVLGGDQFSIAEKILDVIKNGVNALGNLKKREGISFGPQHLKSEYDFQNCIESVLKPWLPDLQREPFQISYSEMDKFADFSFSNGAFVIEAKYISDRNKLNQVITDIKGLKEIYFKNTGTRMLTFPVLYEPDTEIDCAFFETDLSGNWDGRGSLIRFIQNIRNPRTN